MRLTPRPRTAAVAVLALSAAAWTAAAPSPASAAGSAECSGGGFSLVLPGSTLRASGDRDLTADVAASRLGTSFLLKGRYVEFRVTSASFGITGYTLTGAANPADLTGGQRTVVFASKTPDHRGARLTGAMEVRLRGSDVVLRRGDGAVEMKVQAKDCAAGGIFQMEPEREDGTATVITHRLADGAFYYDNPRFRERIGTTVPYTDATGQTVQLPVPARVNLGVTGRPALVGRDSAQVATRVDQCSNAFGTHCGGVSTWRVASGGRMGQVMGEDAVEVSPAATDCVTDCQAQNQVNGQAVVLGFPAPVPAASRLTPRLP
jgi:hypothetical protein